MNLKDRILLFADEKKIKRADLYDCIGMTKSNFSGKAMESDLGSKVVAKILNNYPEIDPDWLLNGIGDMLRKNNQAISVAPNDNSDYYLVPLYSFDAAGSMDRSNSEVSTFSYIERYIPFTEARKGDFAMSVLGNSMQPIYPSGSIVLLREVLDWRNYFGYGDTFVLTLNDERRILKKILRSAMNPKTHILCVSINPEYPAEELARDSIYSVYKVIAHLIQDGF